MKRRVRCIFILALTVFAVFIWREVFAFSDLTLKFYLLDVGQGDALFIETPTKNQILIDAGPDTSVLRELGAVMPFYDRSLDLVILTHPHLDHVGGLAEVLKRYRVSRFIDAGDSYPLAEYQEVKRLVQENYISYNIARRGMKIAIDENVTLDVFYPATVVSSSNPHRNAIIARLSFGASDFLLMADAEKPEEFSLLETGDDIQSEVLKVGHHGSRTSSSELFLERVSPDYALISLGRKNRYGHPHEEVLQNLKKAGAEIFRTDIHSRIEIRSDGRQLTLSHRR